MSKIQHYRFFQFPEEVSFAAEPTEESSVLFFIMECLNEEEALWGPKRSPSLDLRGNCWVIWRICREITAGFMENVCMQLTLPLPCSDLYSMLRKQPLTPGLRALCLLHMYESVVGQNVRKWVGERNWYKITPNWNWGKVRKTWVLCYLSPKVLQEVGDRLHFQDIWSQKGTWNCLKFWLSKEVRPAA